MTTPVWGYIVRVLPLGLGVGTFQATNNTAVMRAVPVHRLGIASGLLALSRNLGVTTGLPIVGVVFTAAVLNFTGAQSLDINSVAPEALKAGFDRTFLLAEMFMIFPAILSAISLWYSKRHC